MARNEIEKALRCCSFHDAAKRCGGCPLFRDDVDCKALQQCAADMLMSDTIRIGKLHERLAVAMKENSRLRMENEAVRQTCITHDTYKALEMEKDAEIRRLKLENEQLHSLYKDCNDDLTDMIAEKKGVRDKNG